MKTKNIMIDGTTDSLINKINNIIEITSTPSDNQKPLILPSLSNFKNLSINVPLNVMIAD